MSEENQPSIKESLNTSLEIIAEEPTLRVLLNAIPSVGGSLNELLAGKGQRIIEERRDNFLLLLRKHVEALDKEAIRKDYFETPEGFDLLIKALDESRKTRSEEKRDLIAKILTGALSTDAGQGEYSPEEYLNVVANLTVKEWEIARAIYTMQQNIFPRELEPSNKMETWRLCAKTLSEEHDIEANALPLFLNRLYSAGLLDLFYVTVPGSPIPTYWVSPTFDKLMEFLRLET